MLSSSANQKFDAYISEFKEKIRDKSMQLGLNNDALSAQLIQYILDYEHLKYVESDFQKRKRVKPFIPVHERCIAKRSDEDQCGRKKRDDSVFCGTHVKGTPYGCVSENELSAEQRVQVWAQDIRGIMYFIDDFGNVYDNSDVSKRLPNPRVIAKYLKTDGVYSIPDFE